MSQIIDRRLNDRNKSAVNRQRFIRRYKAQLKQSVTDLVSRRSITDMEQGGEVKIPVKDISEPQFRHGQGGDREWVLPGNHRFNPGDKLPKPTGEGKGQGGSGEGGDGESQFEFAFTLSREEFMNLFFDDLELPHLVRNFLGDIRESKWQRAGYTPSGVPSNLSVVRSLRNAMARRIAVAAPLRRQLQELEARQAPAEDIERIEKRIDHIPFLDEFDLRYRHRIRVPQPISRAVMFCLMDVSASMTDDKKDLAKRFFTLLYLFLTRKYEKVDLIFIRHTDHAQEVSEEKFFHDTATGGTVVFSALQLMQDIITKRYPPNQWNIYGAQVSDGDAFGADPEKSRGFLSETLLPQLRYFTYIEVPDHSSQISPLAHAYHRIESEQFAMHCVTDRSEVYPALRKLFAKEHVA